MNGRRFKRNAGYSVVTKFAIFFVVVLVIGAVATGIYYAIENSKKSDEKDIKTTEKNKVDADAELKKAKVVETDLKKKERDAMLILAQAQSDSDIKSAGEELQDLRSKLAVASSAVEVTKLKAIIATLDDAISKATLDIKTSKKIRKRLTIY